MLTRAVRRARAAPPPNPTGGRAPSAAKGTATASTVRTGDVAAGLSAWVRPVENGVGLIGHGSRARIFRAGAAQIPPLASLLTRKLVLDLTWVDFVARRENVLAFDPSGPGNP